MFQELLRLMVLLCALYISPNGYIQKFAVAGGGRTNSYIALGNTASLHQFYIGNSSNLRIQFAYNDVFFNPNVVCFATVKTNNYDTHNDSEIFLETSAAGLPGN